MTPVLFAAVLGLAVGGEQNTEICPWLNSATAAGILGGDVVLSFARNASNQNDGTCQYTRRSGNASFVLRIEVNTMKDPAKDFGAYLKSCESNRVPVAGIGNEAFACSPSEPKRKMAEQIVSRVRDRALTVQISTNDAAAKPSDLRERAEDAAEQVAGNLF